MGLVALGGDDFPNPRKLGQREMQPNSSPPNPERCSLVGLKETSVTLPCLPGGAPHPLTLHLSE